jgi:hypothetical protein
MECGSHGRHRGGCLAFGLRYENSSNSVYDLHLTYLIQFNTWGIADNTYEANQWSLGWEMRGSMLLFLGLTMFVQFTCFWRRVFLIYATAYFFENGEFSPALFYAGALLAEISLVVSLQPQTITPAHDNRGVSQPWKMLLKKYWPVALAILALFIGSSPPEGQHRAAYSRFLWTFFERHITPNGGTHYAI